MAKRQYDCANHGNQKYKSGGLEVIDVFGVENLAQRFGVREATSGGRGGNCNAFRGNGPGRQHQCQFNEHDKTYGAADGEIVQHALAELDEIHIEHHNDEKEQYRDGADINDDQDHGEEFGAQQNEKPSCVEETQNEKQYGVHRVARRDHHHSRGYGHTGEEVKEYFKNQETILNEIATTLKNPQDVLKSVASLQDDNVKLKKQIEQLVKEKIDGLKNNLVTEFQEVNGINFLAKQVDLSMSATKDLAHELGISKPNAFVFLASIEDSAPNIHCYISKELVAEKGLNAGTVIRELGKLIDGNGGGQPFFASGKGKNISV